MFSCLLQFYTRVVLWNRNKMSSWLYILYAYWHNMTWMCSSAKIYDCIVDHHQHRQLVSSSFHLALLRIKVGFSIFVTTIQWWRLWRTDWRRWTKWSLHQLKKLFFFRSLLLLSRHVLAAAVCCFLHPRKNVNITTTKLSRTQIPSNSCHYTFRMKRDDEKQRKKAMCISAPVCCGFLAK